MTKTSKNYKTKEEFYNLMDYLRNILNLESILYDYDVEYSHDEDFGNNFYKYLVEKHYITTEQIAVMLGESRDGYLCSIYDFMDIMIKGYEDDFSDISTLTIKQFESILCSYFEKNNNLGNSLFKNIEEHKDEINWAYLYNFTPDTIYEEPPIQNSECLIDIKDVEFLKNATESLENMIEENDKVTKDILKSIKKILDKIK